MAKLRGKSTDEGKRTRDRDTAQMWARVEDASLRVEAELARAELMNVGWA